MSSSPQHEEALIGLSQSNHVELEFQSALRLRPLSKKERADTIVLEPVQDGKDPPTAVLHPNPVSKSQPATPKSSSELRSPESFHFSKDTEFHHNHILSVDADQEKVFDSVGRPMARSAMKSLKQSKNSDFSKSCSLLVCVGLKKTGKSFTCFGDPDNIPKRVTSECGLAPRILDSLFSQSKHHTKNKKVSFGVRISVLQVTHDKNGHSEQQNDCAVHDLYQTVNNENVVSSNNILSSPKLQSVRTMVARMELTGPSATKPADESGQVSIIQDRQTMDFRALNVTEKICFDAIESRTSLHEALITRRRVTSKQTKSHILVIIQPILVAGSDRSKVVRAGGKMGILDMASIELKKISNQFRRDKDCIGNGGGGTEAAMASLLHCFRTLKHNENIRKGKTPGVDMVDNIDDNLSDISSASQQKSTGVMRRHSMKKIPYRQHKLTMLLQPFFSAHKTMATNVTLLLTASPGHRDYAEKKSILNEFEQLHGAALIQEATSNKAALTGLNEPIPSILSSPLAEDDSIPCSTKTPKHKRKKKSKPKEETKLSPSAPPQSFPYSDDEQVYPLPPPCVPNAPPAPSPSEKKSESKIVDFPGVLMPSHQETAGNDVDKAVSFENTSVPLATNRVDPPYRAVQTGENGSTKFHDPKKTFFEKSFHLGNKVVHASKIQGKKVIQKAATAVEQQTGMKIIPMTSSDDRKGESTGSTDVATSKIKSASSLQEYASSTFATKNMTRSGEALEHRLKKLEAQNREIARKNKVLQDKYNNKKQDLHELKMENERLKLSVSDAHLQSMSDDWSDHDEKVWQQSKKQRLLDQRLLRSPVLEHLEAVKSSFEYNGRWNFQTGKSHFELKYPSYFTRASELDLRDKQAEDAVFSKDTKTVEGKENARDGNKLKENARDGNKQVESNTTNDLENAERSEQSKIRSRQAFRYRFEHTQKRRSNAGPIPSTSGLLLGE